MRNLVINCNVSVKESFDEEKMQRLSGIYDSDCYK